AGSKAVRLRTSKLALARPPLVQRLSDVALGRLGARDLSLAIESANLGLGLLSRQHGRTKLAHSVTSDCRICASSPPPGREEFQTQKITQGPIPESAARFDFGPGGGPRPLGDVASFGDDTPMEISIHPASTTAAGIKLAPRSLL